MLIDAHTHIRPEEEGDFRLLLRRNSLISLVSASNPAEYHRLANHFTSEMDQGRVFLSYGVHPWEVTGELTPSQIALLHQAAVIGEIGMDTVWCQTPLPLQRTVFLQQLHIALSQKKPIVLHSKGAENEIAAILEASIPLSSRPKIAVHWYAGPQDALNRLIRLGCYFTLAPDVASNPAQLQVAGTVPQNRLLTESDGVEGISWARGEDAAISDIPHCLETIIKQTAKLRGVEEASLEKAVYENFMEFVL